MEDCDNRCNSSFTLAQQAQPASFTACICRSFASKAVIFDSERMKGQVVSSPYNQNKRRKIRERLTHNKHNNIKIQTLMLYGHLRNHTSFVAGCLLWIRTNGTWKKGHSLLPLAVALEPVDCCIRLPVRLPAIAQAQPTNRAAGAGQGQGTRRPPQIRNSPWQPFLVGAPVVVGSPTGGARSCDGCLLGLSTGGERRGTREGETDGEDSDSLTS
ncbi:hypothetical protein C2845_PM13G22160 [Panicum miliaceum]|uniref:Uncharacterized protein n=1 Tax=Panicum miliaceum TaxID=4540 RepID=A0A3L6RKL6_PANMI|nr:hypothetical protein C2845_PM13G22160 [Panicum miliaceum]